VPRRNVFRGQTSMPCRRFQTTATCGVVTRTRNFWLLASAVDVRVDTSSALLRLDDPSWAECLESVLRGAGLDILPLLFNVLRGDMSLIGPQPITVRQLSHYNGLMPE